MYDDIRYDWEDSNPDNNGGTYYGKDDGEGHTDWYNSDGEYDCTTDTPSYEDIYTRRIEYDDE